MTKLHSALLRGASEIADVVVWTWTGKSFGFVGTNTYGPGWAAYWITSNGRIYVPDGRPLGELRKSDRSQNVNQDDLRTPE
jgi:hypothetical protein